MKPWHYWAVFLICLCLVMTGMGWVSRVVFILDKSQDEARRDAEYQERIRLALWRMENAVAPLIAIEMSRPYFHYRAFHAAERAYNGMFEELAKGEVLIPSPLLTQKTPKVLMHFQYDGDGHVSSPELPQGRYKQVAVPAYMSEEMYRGYSNRLESLANNLTMPEIKSRLDRQPEQQVATLTLQETKLDMQDTINDINFNQPQQVMMANAAIQQQKNINEWQMRQGQAAQSSMRYDQADEARSVGEKETVVGKLSGYTRWNGRSAEKTAPKSAPAESPQPVRGVSEGLMQPFWAGDMLVLARNVQVGKESYFQGCLLDWPLIRNEMLAQIQDLLPGADVVALRDGAAGGRSLAALPVELRPGNYVSRSWGLTPAKMALAISWCCVLLACAAVGVLLIGAVSLSERRGAFVSAVTHELRTPLTTFRMYSEMLADGMIRDGQKKQEYLDTLKAESNRLSHLVENVLSYARLERGRHTGKSEVVSASAIMERVSDRLVQRAKQAGMELVVEPAADLNGEIRTDVSAVEQILFNLVDNACKYAVKATDRRIHVEVASSDGKILFRVRDHGPGVAHDVRKRLFRPFSKSAKMAAESAQGVGLGLALSRRLARQLGGNLELDSREQGGACFLLSIRT